MTEKIISLLKTGQFRKLENFIKEHNFDIATPISCEIDDRSFDNCPFYNVVGIEGDKELVQFVLSQNFTPSIFCRHYAFSKACRDGCIGVVEVMLETGKISLEEKDKALLFLSLDYDARNKDKIIYCLQNYSAK